MEEKRIEELWLEFMEYWVKNPDSKTSYPGKEEFVRKPSFYDFMEWYCLKK